jgi:hypothetical protein
VWPQPGAQQGPEPFHGVDVHLAEAVAILIARILALCVTDRLVPIALSLQTGLGFVFVGVDLAALHDSGLDDRLDRGLPHLT